MIINNKVMLVTGAAQRIGAYIAKAAHADGFNMVLHYRTSTKQTQALTQQLNDIRPNSCISIQADFNITTDYKSLVNIIADKFNRLDVLVNNASDFFPTDVFDFDLEDYEKLFNSNVKGPLFLSQACVPLLKQTKGSIINMVDIHADKPLKNHPLYSMAKAANKMMVQALAKELSPEVRVNGIAPGCIIWPTKELSETEKQEIISRAPLARIGSEKNIYQTIEFILLNNFITGQIITVDGGRSLNM